MDDNLYKVDVAALNQEKELKALENVEKIISNTASSNNISFLKKNYDFGTLRERKTEVNIRVVLSVLWTKIGILGGFKSEMGSDIAQDITNLIFSVYSDLTIEEIYKAFELERFGLYSEKTKHFQFFNSEYVSEILKKYKNWKADMKIAHNIANQKNILALPESTDLDKRNIRIQFIKMVWNELQEKKECFVSWSLYQDLEQKINASDERKNDMYNLELAKYQIELRNKKSTDFQSINNYNDLLKEIEKNNKISVVINRCKSKLVNEFILSHINSIEELLKTFGYE